jgi:hypothetical protein
MLHAARPPPHTSQETLAARARDLHWGATASRTASPRFMRCTARPTAGQSSPRRTSNSSPPAGLSWKGAAAGCPVAGSTARATSATRASSSALGEAHPSPGVSTVRSSPPSPVRSRSLAHPRSSMSNTRVARPGILGGLPAAP